MSRTAQDSKPLNFDLISQVQYQRENLGVGGWKHHKSKNLECKGVLKAGERLFRGLKRSGDSLKAALKWGLNTALPDT